MRVYPMIAIMLLAASAARAEDSTIRFGAAQPLPFVSRVPDAKIIHMPNPARNPSRPWLDYCQPQEYIDHYGVTRMRYAKAGCEFGITGPREGE